MSLFNYVLIKILLLIIAKDCFAQSTQISSPVVYKVPEPKIEILKPHGLQVSIPDSPGIQLFAFHGNINKPLPDIAAGDLSRDIIRKDNNNRWVFKDRNLHLKPGDRIYFWLYVMKDNLGYRSLNNIYTVEDDTSDVDISSNCCNNNKHDNLDIRPNPDNSNQSTTCERTLVNLTQTLLNLHDSVEDLRETNRLLMEIIEKSRLTQTLRLEGVGRTFDDPVDIVKIVLKEKLKLPSINVIKAVSNGNDRITFDIDTLNEKLSIIKSAKKYLLHSKFTITY